MPLCSTPLGSPTGVPNTVLLHVRAYCAWPALTVVGTGMGTGWVVPGWVYRGVLPSHPATLLEEDPRSRQRSGPRRPPAGRLEWVVCGSGRTGVRRRRRALTHHSLRSGPLRWSVPSECRPWANRARFNVISQKLSENGQASPKSVEKAYHSPYFQNGSRISPLGFLRFPISPAFSHKELIGPF